MYDVVIIGCGVVGAAVARELSKYNISLAVIEAQNDVAMGQTKANSAIIHAGYDPKEDSEMARLNILGNRLTAELCSNLNVKFKRVGSLVLAFNEADMEHIKRLLQRGERGGIEGLEIWNREKCLAEEPFLTHELCGALYAPSAGIINPWEFALALAEVAVKNNADILFNSCVSSIKADDGGFIIKTQNNREIKAKYVINAAGVHSDEIASMAGDNSVKILPTRGEYYLLDKTEGKKIKHIIFQCPTPKGKGVLVAPTVHGNLIVGPNAEEVFDKSDTSTTIEGLDQVAQVAAKSVSNINFRDNVRNFAGIRANGENDEFIIEESRVVKGFFNLAGIKSPGLTAAAAIAVKTVEMLKNCSVKLTEKAEFIEERSTLNFNDLSASEKNELISKDPRYGRIICRCETVSEGEIVSALHSLIPACSVDGVKRRTNAGMGRCQGGFCSTRIVEIIARELGVDPTEVLQDGAGSRILINKIKAGGLE